MPIAFVPFLHQPLHHGFMARAARLLLAWCVATCAAAAANADGGRSDAELRAAYQQWVDAQGKFEYRTRHLLVPTRAEASAALAEIQGGAAFAEVAARVSKDPGSKGRGGDLGWVNPAEFVAEFANAQRNSRVGLHPEVVKTVFGWHVILIEAVRPLALPSFEQMRPRLEASARRAPEPRAKPLPAWSLDQLNRVFSAALHTAGMSSYVYTVAEFESLEKAQRDAAFRLAAVPTAQRRQYRARNLIDVEPPLRLAVARLFTADSVSAPVERVLADGRKVWQVVQLSGRDRAEPLQATDAFKAELAAWVDRGLLPPPERLDTPEERARVAYRRATTPAQVAAVPQDLPADVSYGDESTPLLDAISRDDMESAKLLVLRGADVNRCGLWGCPIAHAANRKDAASALAWVNWLLQAGARADGRDPRGSGLFDTALSAAAYQGHLAVAQRLLDSGAQVNGDPKARSVPLESAAAAGNRQMVEWLLAHGASLMPRSDPTGLFPRSLPASARESGDRAFVDWAERKVIEAATRHPSFHFNVHVEQGGQRLEPNARQEVRLKPAPFKLVFEFPGGAEGVQVGASLQSTWWDEVRSNDMRNAMFRPLASGALADADQPDSSGLLLSAACPAKAPVDPGCDGTHMWFGIDPSERKDFHEQRIQNGQVKYFVRDVDSLIDAGGPSGGQVPALAMRSASGKTVHLAFAVPLAMGTGGQRLVNAQYLRLVVSR